MKKKIVLIYTELGFNGSYLIQAPISLVYVSTKLVHFPDVEIDILDCRIEPEWRERLRKTILEDDVLMVGFFVMSGLQVGKAYEVTKFVKDINNEIPVVWGGPHPTILPDDVLNYSNIDFCVRGFGLDAFTDLASKMLNQENNYETIPNLCFIRDGKKIIGTINSEYEQIGYKELPYHLLDPIIEKYFVGTENRAFPIYTAFGCPYQCNFCISPIWFEDTRKKWDPLPAEEVVDHIEYLIERFGIDFIYFWDDDSFVSPRHFSSIAEEILRRKVNVQLGVRGIRSNEIERMKSKDFDLMEKVGVKYVHIGVENGSQRMLDAMDKGITVEQSLIANRKLAENKNITPMYNFLVGMPTETMEDLQETGLFMLKLMKENPNAIMYPPNKMIPYPGGKAYEEAVKRGYVTPETPDDWLNMDQEGEVYQPWYTPEKNRYMKVLQLATYALSNWERFLVDRPTWLQTLFKILKSIYKPIARFRLKYYVTHFFIEEQLMKIVKCVLGWLAPVKNS
jgi:anaerobic magnesium-protoporphyrin IX monomethyl ester cyclase